MGDKALEIASRITNSTSLAAFAAVLATIVLVLARRKSKLSTPPTASIILAAGIIILGLSPLAAHIISEWRGVYHVRVAVVRPDGTPAEDAEVSSSAGGEPKKTQVGWEFDIPPQTRPADGKVALFASVKSAFLTGSSTVTLGDDFYPTFSIQLAADTSATVRGVVVDENGRSVAGAQVSIPGYSDVATTDAMGNFVLPAHASDGQIVQVRAQKGRLAGSMSASAGKMPVELVVK